MGSVLSVAAAPDTERTDDLVFYLLNQCHYVLYIKEITKPQHVPFQTFS